MMDCERSESIWWWSHPRTSVSPSPHPTPEIDLAACGGLTMTQKWGKQRRAANCLSENEANRLLACLSLFRVSSIGMGPCVEVCLSGSFAA